MAINLGNRSDIITITHILNDASNKISSILEKLSSGRRITKASDDPAALALANTLKMQSKVNSQRTKSVNDAVSLLNVAHGAVSELETITIKLKELAEQAANNTITSTQRLALHNEATALVDEYNRIISTAEYNERNLLDITQGQAELSLQLGSGNSNKISFNVGTSLSATIGGAIFSGIFDYEFNLSVGENFAVEFLDYNGDGNLDVVAKSETYVTVNLGDGTGAFYDSKGSSQLLTTDNTDIVVADFNNDGKDDIVGSAGIILGSSSLIQENSTVTSFFSTHSIAAGDFNNDGNMDVLAQAIAGGSLRVHLGNGSGGFTSSTTISGSYSVNNLITSDLNNDGKDDFVAINTSGNIVIGIGDGSTNFSLTTTDIVATTSDISLKASDMNNDGYADIIFSNGTDIKIARNSGSGTFSSAETSTTIVGETIFNIGDIDGNGLNDIVVNNNGPAPYLANSSGGFTLSEHLDYFSGGQGEQFGIGDIDNDGFLDLLFEADDSFVYAFIQDTSTTSFASYIDLTTQASATEAINTLDAQIARVQIELGKQAASSSRLKSTISNLDSIVLNLESAYSRITEFNVAEGISELVTRTIRQDTATAIFAQANLSRELVLKLLR